MVYIPSELAEETLFFQLSIAVSSVLLKISVPSLYNATFPSIGPEESRKCFSSSRLLTALPKIALDACMP